MKFNIKLNIKSIIKVEQFLKKPFSLIDHTNESELNALLYCCVLANNDDTFTYEAFCTLLKNEKLSQKIFVAFDKECKTIAQFNQAQAEPTEPEQSESQDHEPPYVKDIVASLIVDGGIDANFIMSANLNDLAIYIKAYEDKKRQQLYNDRLWSFMTVVPHIDTKKCPTDRDFYPFPWEIEEMRAEGLKRIEEQTDELEAFLKYGKDYITGKHK